MSFYSCLTNLGGSILSISSLDQKKRKVEKYIFLLLIFFAHHVAIKINSTGTGTNQLECQQFNSHVLSDELRRPQDGDSMAHQPQVSETESAGCKDKWLRLNWKCVNSFTAASVLV